MLAFTKHFLESFQFASPDHFHLRVAFLLPGIPVRFKWSKPVRDRFATPVALALHKTRKERGLTFKELGRSFDVSPWSILNWEAGGDIAMRFWPRVISFLGYDPYPVVDFASALSAVRRRTGLSIRDAAAAAGLDAETWSIWERGERRPKSAHPLWAERALNLVKPTTIGGRPVLSELRQLR